MITWSRCTFSSYLIPLAYSGRICDLFPHGSITTILLSNSIHEYPYLARRLQVMHPFRCSRFSHKLPLLGRHIPMAEGNHAVAGERATPHGTVCWPPLWIHQDASEEPFGHPQIVEHEWEIDVDQRISGSESLPCGRHAPESIDDPPLIFQQSGMDLQIFGVRDFLTAWPVLEGIDGMERQTGDVRQRFRQRGFATTGIAEHRYPLHMSPLASSSASEPSHGWPLACSSLVNRRYSTRYRSNQCSGDSSRSSTTRSLGSTTCALPLRGLSCTMSSRQRPQGKRIPKSLTATIAAISTSRCLSISEIAACSAQKPIPHARSAHTPVCMTPVTVRRVAPTEAAENSELARVNLPCTARAAVISFSMFGSSIFSCCQKRTLTCGTTRVRQVKHRSRLSRGIPLLLSQERSHRSHTTLAPRSLDAALLKWSVLGDRQGPVQPLD